MTKHSIENRKEKRYPFHWKVAIVFDNAEGQDTFHGVTHELSMSGCSILTEHNVFSERPVSILLSLPKDHQKDKKRIVEVRARMIYTVLSSGHQKFRCGIHFVRFKEDGRAMLKKTLSSRIMSTFVDDE
jgi:hypothetical protein